MSFDGELSPIAEHGPDFRTHHQKKIDKFEYKREMEAWGLSDETSDSWEEHLSSLTASDEDL